MLNEYVFCQNCGAQNETTCNYCKKCATPLKENLQQLIQICQNCGEQNETAYNYCKKCATPLKNNLQPPNQICKKCGEINETTNNYCKKCATLLKENFQTSKAEKPLKVKEASKLEETLKVEEIPVEKETISFKCSKCKSFFKEDFKDRCPNCGASAFMFKVIVGPYNERRQYINAHMKADKIKRKENFEVNNIKCKEKLEADSAKHREELAADRADRKEKLATDSARHKEKLAADNAKLKEELEAIHIKHRENIEAINRKVKAEKETNNKFKADLQFRKQQELSNFLQGNFIGAFIGFNVTDSHMKKFVVEHSYNNEVIQAIVSGRVKELATKTKGRHDFFDLNSDKGGSLLKNYLVVTNTRVVLWARGAFNSSVDSFNYSDIKSVEQQKGIVFGSIVLNIYGKTEHFYEMNKDESSIIADMIRENIRKDKDKAIVQSHNVIIEEDSIIKLEKLASLRDKGIITEEEFKEKKKKLLDLL